MASLINLPAYQVPNALSFQGINNAIDSTRQNALMQRQMGMQEQQLGMQKERFGMEKQQFDQEQKTAAMRRFAIQTAEIDKEQDPARRKMLWDQHLATHPDTKSIPLNYWDPMNGPKMVLQEAEGFLGRGEKAKLGLIEARTQKALREASEAGSGLGKQISPYQTSDGKIWGVQAAANGGRMMHDLSNPMSQPIFIPAGRPMPPGQVPHQGGAPAMGQQPAMPQGGAPVATPGMQPQASPGPLTPFRGVKQVGNEMVDLGSGRGVRNVGEQLRGASFIEAESKAAVADIKSRNEAVQVARGKLPRLQLMAQLIDSPEVYQGTGGNAVLEFKKAAQSLGFDVEGVPASEAVRMVANQFALALRNPAGGEGMPGALSDRDLAFLTQSVPGLANTRGGNQIIVRTMIDMEQYKIAENAEAARYLQKNKSTAGLAEHLQRWADRTPALSYQTRSMIEKATGLQYGVRSGPAAGPRVEGKQPGSLNDPPGRSFASPAMGRQAPAIRSEEEFNALPSGAEFIDPEGNRRRKP